MESFLIGCNGIVHRANMTGVLRISHERCLDGEAPRRENSTLAWSRCFGGDVSSVM